MVAPCVNEMPSHGIAAQLLRTYGGQNRGRTSGPSNRLSRPARDSQARASGRWTGEEVSNVPARPGPPVYLAVPEVAAGARLARQIELLATGAQLLGRSSRANTSLLYPSGIVPGCLMTSKPAGLPGSRLTPACWPATPSAGPRSECACRPARSSTSNPGCSPSSALA